MSDLSADYILMRSKRADLYRLYERLNEEVAGIGRYAADLDIFWDGAANEAFNKKLGEDLVEMGRIVMAIRERIRAFDRIFGIYMDNEKKVADLVGSFGKRK